MKCKVCGREYSKWRFCLECGSINHTYTNKNYIGEDEEEKHRKIIPPIYHLRKMRQIGYDMTDQQE